MQTPPKSHQILGIGTPILDYLITVGEDSLPTHLRGSSLLVDYSTFQKILQENPSLLKTIAGGSAANTINGLSKLGYSCGFVGKIGNDLAGKQFSSNTLANSIVPFLSLGTLPTGQVACLITPDHERTMRTYLGAGSEMTEKELNPELFNNVRLMHIEGYLLNRENVIEKAMYLAKEAGAKISFDVSSFEIVNQYKKQILELLSTFVDILFANEEEARALTDLPPKEACLAIKDFCDTVVVKTGSTGCWGATKNDLHHHPAYPVNVVDTTGAGDLFASGFLHGYLTNKSLEECLRDGAFMASRVIMDFGAQIPEDKWPEISRFTAKI